MARRSVLFTPGDRPEMLRSAPESAADVLVFDLEDAVAPGRKDDARSTIVEVLDEDAFDPEAELCVRVNPVDAGGRADVEALGPMANVLDSLLLPKAAAGSEIRALAGCCREHGVDPTVLALIESAPGVLSAAEIAQARATDALVFGAEDLAADIGATRTDEGTEVAYARQQVVLAARAHDVAAIDTVYTDFEDIDGLAADASRAVQFGYDGKLAIHPNQVQPINEAFTPARERIEWARRVLDARDDAREADRAVFRVDDEMIDAPLIAQAEQIAERARAAGVFDGTDGE
jgi:citrate lyase subunit beta/citryl-CoA lyase